MSTARVLIAIFGMDQHELGAIAVSRLLRDAGMEVIYAGRFNLPRMIVKAAVEEDVDVIGLSCHSWEYVQYIPELMDVLREERVSIPVVVGGSVITASDARSLEAQGVKAVFGPMARDDEIVRTIVLLAASRASMGAIPGHTP